MYMYDVCIRKNKYLTVYIICIVHTYYMYVLYMTCTIQVMYMINVKLHVVLSYVCVYVVCTVCTISIIQPVFENIHLLSPNPL
jgi:hypothetical protein